MGIHQLYDDLGSWLDQEDILYRRFDLLASLVESYVTERLLESRESARQIGGCFPFVLGKCDQIRYDEPGQVEAYVILHFLDRYHRFQIVLQELLRRHLLPLLQESIDALDVGTGPAPALFAVSDMYSHVREFGELKSVERLSALQYKLDYVESSWCFRNWLHHFTEFVNWPQRGARWAVPFHHGAFWDFGEGNLERSMACSEYDGGHLAEEYIEKHRFNLVIFGNFLTTGQVVSGFAEQLRQIARHLHNEGLILVVGARSHSSKKYQDVYDSTRAVISGHYDTKRYVSTCYEIDPTPCSLSYDYSDMYGRRLKICLRRIIDRFDSLGEMDAIPPEMRRLLSKVTSEGYSKAIQWDVQTFQRRCQPRPVAGGGAWPTK